MVVTRSQAQSNPIMSSNVPDVNEPAVAADIGQVAPAGTGAVPNPPEAGAVPNPPVSIVTFVVSQS
jgi:hypothetical protein